MLIVLNLIGNFQLLLFKECRFPNLLRHAFQTLILRAFAFLSMLFDIESGSLIFFIHFFESLELRNEQCVFKTLRIIDFNNPSPMDSPSVPSAEIVACFISTLNGFLIRSLL